MNKSLALAADSEVISLYFGFQRLRLASTRSFDFGFDTEPLVGKAIFPNVVFKVCLYLFSDKVDIDAWEHSLPSLLSRYRNII